MPQQHQNAHGYKLEFLIVGFNSLTGKTIRVRIQRPGGTTFDKLSATGDVQVLDAAVGLVGVKIETGDFTEVGRHFYQAFDETAGVFIPTATESFYVDENLITPAP